MACGRVRISDSFFLDEFSVSESRPDLVEPVPEEYQPSVIRLAVQVLQPIRDHVGRPMIVTSGYRPEALNRAVGGSSTSQHRFGEAADWHIAGDRGRVLRRQFVHMLAGRLDVPCGQCIYYPDSGFVHIALPGDRFPEPSFHLHRPRKGIRYQRLHGEAHLRNLLSR